MTYLTTARATLEQRALDYARLKAFGVFVDDQGKVTHIPQPDRNLIVLADQILEAAEALLLEMTLRPLDEENKS